MGRKLRREGKPIPHDWDGESYSFYVLCAPKSLLWDGYVRGAIFELTRGRGWDRDTGNIKATQEIAWEIYDSMAKCDELITQMTRIADTLETRLPTPITLRDIAQEITGTTWLGSFADELEALNYLSELVPFWNVDWAIGEGLAGEILSQIGQAYRFQMTMAQWNRTNQILMGLAAAEGGETVSEVIDTIDDTLFDLLQTVAAMGVFALDLKDDYNQFISNLLSFLFGEEGVGVDTKRIADAVEAIALENARIATAVEGLPTEPPSVTVQNFIDLCCSGVPDLPTPTAPPGVISVPQSPTDGLTPPPDGEGITWEQTPRVDNDKCKAAGYVVDAVIEFFDKLDGAVGANETPSQSQLVTVIVTALSIMTAVIILPTWGLIEIAAALSSLWGAGFSLSNLAGQAKQALIDNRSDLVCAMYEGSDANGAKANIDAALGNVGLGDALTNIVRAVFNVSYLNSIFFGNNLIDVSGQGEDCSGCASNDPLVYFQQRAGVICGTLVSGSLVDNFVARSTYTEAFGDQRQQIRLRPVTPGHNIRYTVTLGSSTETYYWVDYLDENGVYQTIDWSTGLPSNPIVATDFAITGGTVNGENVYFEVNYTVEVVT